QEKTSPPSKPPPPPPPLVPPPKAVRLTTGLEGFCAVLDNGKVSCWGGSPEKPIPRILPNIDNAVDVTRLTINPHDELIVIARTDGSVLSLAEGQEIPNNFKYLNNVQRVHGNRSIADGTLFGGVLCALHRDGTVSCFPRGAMQPEAKPLSMPGWTDVLELSVSLNHVCARMPSGIQCVRHGDLGTSKVVRVPLPEGKTAVSMQVGFSVLCVAFESKTVACQDLGAPKASFKEVPGANPFGLNQLGWLEVDVPIVCATNGNHVTCSRMDEFGSGVSLPALEKGDVSLEGFGSVEELAIAPQAACLRNSDGAIACWGHNEKGGLGQASQRYLPRPRKLSDIPAMKNVQVGKDFTCALSQNREVWCWGPTPQPVPSLSGIVRLIAQSAYACAWNSSGQAHCFFGKTEKRLPIRVPALDHAIAVGLPDMGVLGSVAALFDDGSLRIGHNPNFSSLENLHLSPEPRFNQGKDMAMSEFGDLVVLDRQGDVYLARVNKGQIVRAPTPAPLLRGAVQVRPRQALMADGTVRTWSDSSSPPTSWGQAIRSLVGPSYCAITAENQVQCWSYRGTGSPLQGVVQAEGTGNDSTTHLCGVDSQGAVFCRGNNQHGQCGNHPGIEYTANPVLVNLSGSPKEP
ncbi:MAG TPA: hypothetical protein PKW66_10585, partial [Polyangiaceae bacterium]|nr:hypothetical protein [Polyangiaceae bacterium]